MGMLRITIAETLSEQRWTLEGRLVQPWTSELKSTWTKTEIARRERKCVVDVTGVTFIDKSGEKVLAALSKGRADPAAFRVGTVRARENFLSSDGRRSPGNAVGSIAPRINSWTRRCVTQPNTRRRNYELLLPDRSRRMSAQSLESYNRKGTGEPARRRTKPL